MKHRCWLACCRYGSTIDGKELFVYRVDRPFRPPDGWLSWALLGCCTAPLIAGTTSLIVEALGYNGLAAGKGTVDGVVPLISLSGPTYLNLLTTTGVLAPLLEETVFRGFLLVSLTKCAFAPDMPLLLLVVVVVVCVCVCVPVCVCVCVCVYKLSEFAIVRIVCPWVSYFPASMVWYWSIVTSAHIIYGLALSATLQVK